MKHQKKQQHMKTHNIKNITNNEHIHKHETHNTTQRWKLKHIANGKHRGTLKRTNEHK